VILMGDEYTSPTTKDSYDEFQERVSWLGRRVAIWWRRNVKKGWRQTKFHDRVTLILSLGGFGVLVTYTIATIVYASITSHMWKEMQTQTRIQRDAAINSERAWVGLDGPVKTDALQATPTFAIGGHYNVRNFGHGPALKVFPYAIPVWDTEKVDYMNVAKTACAGPIGFATGTLPGQPNPGPMGYMLFPDQLHPEAVGQGIWQGAGVPPIKHFWFIGCIAYIDQFKALHWTRFCVEPPYTVRNPSKDTPLQFCALYNDAGDGEPSK
jgi:hypothetical protein